MNLIMGREVVKELIQHELTLQNILAELNLILTDSAKQQKIKSDYTELKKILSEGGNASKNAAAIIATLLK